MIATLSINMIINSKQALIFKIEKVLDISILNLISASCLEFKNYRGIDR